MIAADYPLLNQMDPNKLDFAKTQRRVPLPALAQLEELTLSSSQSPLPRLNYDLLALGCNIRLSESKPSDTVRVINWLLHQLQRSNANQKEFRQSLVNVEKIVVQKEKEYSRIQRLRRQAQLQRQVDRLKLQRKGSAASEEQNLLSGIDDDQQQPRLKYQNQKMELLLQYAQQAISGFVRSSLKSKPLLESRTRNQVQFRDAMSKFADRIRWQLSVDREAASLAEPGRGPSRE